MNDMAVWWLTHIQDRNLKSRIPHPLDLLGKGADRLITSTPPPDSLRRSAVQWGGIRGSSGTCTCSRKLGDQLSILNATRTDGGTCHASSATASTMTGSICVSRAQIEQRHRKPNIPAPLQVCDASSPPGLPTHACLSTHSAGTPTNPTVGTRQKW